MKKGENPNDLEEQLEDIFGLLSAHSEFRILRVRHFPILMWTGYWLGGLVKLLRSLRFSAEFDHKVTLLLFRIRREGPSAVVLHLLWYAQKIPPECFVFVHFLDKSDNIRLQGDHLLPAGLSGVLGRITSQCRIELPADLPGRDYRVRLGVWLPRQGVHLPLTKTRGCHRDSAGCSDSIILGWYRL